MKRELKLRTKLFAGYFVILFLMISISAFVYYNVSSLMKSVGWVNHTYQVLEEIGEIEKAIVDMETGERGFLIAGKESFLEPYHNGKKTIETAITNAKDLTSDNPKQVERFEEVKKLIHEWYNKAAEVEIQARRDMDQGKLTMDDVRNLILAETGKELMDKMRKVLDAAHDEENRLIKPRIESQVNNEKTTNIALFFGTLLALILGISIGTIIIRGVTKQLGGEPKDVMNIAKQLSEGDFTVDIVVNHDDSSSALFTMKTMKDNLEKLIATIIMSAQNLGQAVEQISQGNQNLSQRTSEQASSLEEVASTIEEATSAINQNADNAENANGQAKNSSKLAIDGGTLVNDAVSSINEINQTSKQIGEIISVINEIAFQTNLLALNAAVEAARAGEQGRGFAVVAGEVRNLAQRSGNAAKEIGDLIKDSISKIGIGTEKANKSGESLTEIINSIENVSKLISEIALASREQKQGIAQINTAIAEMDTMTQQNSALVEETASASEEMSNQAEELLRLVQRFKINNNFKQDISRSLKRSEIHLSEMNKVASQKNKATKDIPAHQFKAAETKKNISSMMSEEGFEEF